MERICPSNTNKQLIIMIIKHTITRAHYTNLYDQDRRSHKTVWLMATFCPKYTQPEAGIQQHKQTVFSWAPSSTPN